MRHFFILFSLLVPLLSALGGTSKSSASRHLSVECSGAPIHQRPSQRRQGLFRLRPPAPGPGAGVKQHLGPLRGVTGGEGGLEVDFFACAQGRRPGTEPSAIAAVALMRVYEARTQPAVPSCDQTCSTLHGGLCDVCGLDRAFQRRSPPAPGERRGDLACVNRHTCNLGDVPRRQPVIFS